MANENLNQNQKKYSRLATASFSLAVGALPGVGVTWLLARVLHSIGQVLVLLMGLFLIAPIPLGMAAIVSGAIAIRQGKNHILHRRWMAIVGIVLGSLEFLLFTLLAVTIIILYARNELWG